MAELFNVVFAGELSGRAELAVVRANVGKLFNASEAVLDKLFSGQPVAVKKRVDRATAMKIRALMKQAGANTQLVPVDEQGRPLSAAAAPTASPSPSPPPPAGSMAARVASLAAQHAREEAQKPKPDAPPATAVVDRVETWALYPAGWTLSAPVPRPAPLMPDISRLSMSAPRTDLVRPGEIAAPPPVKVDISGISMAPPNTEVLKDSERPRVVPVQVDISGLSVAPVGAPLDEIREEKVRLNPDISGISLADE